MRGLLRLFLLLWGRGIGLDAGGWHGVWGFRFPQPAAQSRQGGSDSRLWDGLLFCGRFNALGRGFFLPQFRTKNSHLARSLLRVQENGVNIIFYSVKQTAVPAFHWHAGKVFKCGCRPNGRRFGGDEQEVIFGELLLVKSRFGNAADTQASTSQLNVVVFFGLPGGNYKEMRMTTLGNINGIFSKNDLRKCPHRA